MSGLALHTFVARIPRGSHSIKARKCRGAFYCGLGLGKQEVWIEATKDASYLNRTNAGQFGTVVAVVNNLGTMQTARYDFDPHVEYVFVVYNPAQPGADGSWDLQRIYQGAGGWEHQSVKTGRFHFCEDGSTWEPSIADFADCHRHRPTAQLPTRSYFARMGMLNLAPVRALYTAVTRALAPLDYGESSAWVSCDPGCCTMTGEG